MWLLCLASLAFGRDRTVGEGPVPPRWQEPNVIVGVAAGRPGLVSVRGEAWLSSRFSAEVGFGLPELDLDELAADVAFRFRPDVFCVGCGGQDLLLVGVGVGAAGSSDRGFERWRFALGPDVAVTGVHWFTPELGVHATIRGGFGPSFASPDAGVEAVDWWSFGVVGLSF